MPDRANLQIRKVIGLVGQDNPGHRGRVGTEESCPSTIGCMNGERAEAEGHGLNFQKKLIGSLYKAFIDQTLEDPAGIVLCGLGNRIESNLGEE